MEDPAAQSVYHIAHAKKDAISLGTLLELAFETFSRKEDFR